MANVVLVCDWSLRRLNRLQSVRKVRGIPTVQSWNATYSSIAKNIENRRGAKTHPCFVPQVTVNVDDAEPLSSTEANMPSWNDCTIFTNLSGQPLHTESHCGPGLVVTFGC